MQYISLPEIKKEGNMIHALPATYHEGRIKSVVFRLSGQTIDGRVSPKSGIVRQLFHPEIERGLTEIRGE